MFGQLVQWCSHTIWFYFRDMFCAGRVQEEDLLRTMKACGGAIQTSVNSMTDDVLGKCELFEENQIGGERYCYLIFKQLLLLSFSTQKNVTDGLYQHHIF